ncbi:TetR/AcrR family transcriptional regulator [Bordetella hinzii]|uniref:TetR/AcrR family transcriptional regulator n=1 Tax=Bordetella hinzii TaxID=103855 RepID=UPI001C0231BC|nr:TetR/AcrR family transcriptional regulator [Bordetella hinzii]QWF46466.1 TetR/AcrR family transcriptional regulator [Bordetella hinzii]
MARPRSEDKRNAILASAAHVIARQGIAAPTARIAKEAGIAEGSLFTYFPNKDELLNALYREVKLELSRTMMAGYPQAASARERLRHMWNRYVQWGAHYPQKFKAVTQLGVSDRVREDVKAECRQHYTALQSVLEESVSNPALLTVPWLFVSALMTVVAETTMGFMAREPQRADDYSAAGFEAFRNAITA